MKPLSRMTMPTRAVLAALLAGRSYGWRIAAEARLRPATVYEILARLELAGLAASSWEDRAGPDALRDMGAPRRYWDLTPEGQSLARWLA
jgi:DNA-binding PadR family transcriptional regulator